MQETHIFSPNVINTFTAGLSRVGSSFNTPPLIPLPPSLSFVQGQIPGNLVVGGGALTTQAALTSAGAGVGAPWLNGKTLFTYADGLQIIKGSHRISLGVSFQRLRSNEIGATRGVGQASFGSLQSFLQGIVGNFQVTPNSTPHYWRQLAGAWYLQDAIQVRQNLSVRLGLRHEFTNGWNDALGRAANFIFDSNGVIRTNPMTGNSVFTENNAKWLFSPRIGLAWDPFGKGKTSIRAGLGTYYNVQDVLGFYLKDTPPFNSTVAFQNVPFLSLVPVVPGIALPPSCGPEVPRPCSTYAPTGVQPTMKTPTVEEWNFAVEQQITPNTSFRVSYVGSHGFHELILVDPNSIRPVICSDPAGCTSGGVGSARGSVPQGAEYIPVGTRPNPFVGKGVFWFSEGNSSNHALRVEATRRFSYGLQFRANYTWSKNLNIESAQTPGGAFNEGGMVMNPYDVKRDWGLAAQDIKHQFSFSGGYEFPLGHGKPWLSGVSGAADKLASGWQLNWIVTALSGFPFTPLVGSNQSGNGDTHTPDRPSVNPAFTGPVILGTPNRWFNPNAFILPVPGTWGNVGRGTLRGPGLAEFDMSLFKSTSLTERVNLQFRAECFNLLNHSNFGPFGRTVFSGGAINPSAGVITSTATTSRQLQFGLKLVF